METNNRKAALELEAKYARNQAVERLQSAMNTLQRNTYCIETYLEKLEAATDDAERARVLNGAINHLVCNIQPNLRIDLLAQSQAELTKLGCVK